MASEKVCPKCGGQMTLGGLREDSSILWGHLKEGSIFGVKTVQMIPPIYTIDAHRCDKCGYLELYAVREQRK